MLARRVSAEGRTRAYLGGRSATAADLRGARRRAAVVLRPARAPPADARLRAARDPRRLLRARAGGAPRGVRGRLRARAGAARASWRSCARAPARAIASSTCSSGSSRRSSARSPSEAEEEALLAERERLRHLEALHGRGRRRRRGAAPATRTAGGAAPALAAAPSALEARPRRRRRARRAGRPRAGARRRGRRPGGRAAPLRRGRSTRRPGRLDEVEERLALLDRLKRKHGGTIAAVLAHAEECRARRDELAGAEEALEAGEARARGRAAPSSRSGPRGCATARRDGRRRARRARCVERLAGLAMEGASFEARVAPSATATGRRGGDEVEFLIAPNPGVPAGPLRETASGGELSRVMLALMGVAGRGRAGARWSSTRSTPGSAARPRARSASSCATLAGRPPGHLHHPPAADRLARRPPLHDRQGHVGRHRTHDRHAARARRRGRRARADARRRRTATPPPAATPEELLKAA